MHIILFTMKGEMFKAYFGEEKTKAELKKIVRKDFDKFCECASNSLNIKNGEALKKFIRRVAKEL